MRDVVLTVGDLVEALDCANGRIEAIDKVLSDFEVRFGVG